MKSKIVCIFAHPDDEAFGPGGTIAKYSQTNDVYILCATKGEAGQHDAEKNIAGIREKELIASAQILGVREVRFLGFMDGQLCNNQYPALTKIISQHLDEIQPEALLTFEPLGVSGHIDHAVMSLVTSYVFEHKAFVKELLYYCHSREQVKEIKKVIGDYFVYFPPGYKKTEINKIIDITSVWNNKVKAMQQHQSQIHDVKLVLSFLEKMPKLEYFLVINK